MKVVLFFTFTLNLLLGKYLLMLSIKYVFLNDLFPSHRECHSVILGINDDAKEVAGVKKRGGYLKIVGRENVGDVVKSGR